MTGPVVDALLPPAILALLALALVIAGRRRVAAVAVAALVLLATEGVPHLLMTPLFLKPTPPPNPAPAAIVVLASGMPELLDASRSVPSLETLARLRTAAALARVTGRRILVSGARVADGQVPVATQMAMSLEADFKMPATWAETRSANLWQSADASAALLRAAGISDVYLVAQPWELRLAAAVFHAAGLAVTPVPVPHAHQRALDRSAFIVITPNWLDSARALREWTGLACQSLAPCVDWMRGPRA